jgi:hypothetical protein
MAQTTLGSLAAGMVGVSANSHVVKYFNQWLNWTIREIYCDRLWDFRVKSGTVIIQPNSWRVALPETFDKPNQFRIVTPGFERKLFGFDRGMLVRASPHWNDTSDSTRFETPTIYITPFASITGIPQLETWPVADAAYNVDYDYYDIPGDLDDADPCPIPKKWEFVIIDRMMIYIKGNEDETDLSPWMRKYEHSLMQMRAGENRRPDSLPSWRHEKQLINVNRALTNVRNDVDYR